MKVQLLLGALLPLVSAHFELIYPAARGFDEDNLGQFPCGGQNTVTTNRTEFPITGAPIQLLMGHTSAKVQVLLALGNDPGSNFNITLLPTFQEKGPQNFCIGAGALQFPTGLNITEGMNATIQVVTNGDPSGGLYNCADITFTSTQLSASDYSSHCSNSTGVTVSALTNAGNANSSTSDSTTSAAASGSTSAAASAASGTSTGAAAQATFAGFALGAMGVLAGMAAL
ncbi:hypothetical protein D6C98_03699 [Aureobasidium pullulans]|uniref:Copper acquisition factor BIM1-like domain-containing protein n=1 Tax=Aureobasidium pullulans TaxID=5580 RepID=A0A4S9YWN5_AURPU|nr:hypothetical protein D6C98_03699 [Aureobasidium pullulans]THZ71755.1 hypothetical protein D6C85_05091 [Aureobasidium pullulans]THZ96731.1 hypothetical protein D6C82_06872 [Aureobasidium pullulans]